MNISRRILAMLPKHMRAVSDEDYAARKQRQNLHYRVGKGVKPRVWCPCGVAGHFAGTCPTNGIPPTT